MASYVDFLLTSVFACRCVCDSEYALDGLVVLAMILNPRAKRESKSLYGVRDVDGGGTVGGGGRCLLTETKRKFVSAHTLL
jgi:hypothetical protein